MRMVAEGSEQGHGQVEQLDRVIHAFEQRPSCQHAKKHADRKQQALDAAQGQPPDGIFLLAFRALTQTLAQGAVHQQGTARG